MRRTGVGLALYAAVLLACAAGAAWVERPAAASSARGGAEWPTSWDGRALRPLATSEVEQRFAARFPGRIARFADGRGQLVLREVDEPTRMLHPAADCYRGLGYRIEAARLETDAGQRRWRCFDAVRDGRSLRVCERITDGAGAAWTDTSSWFWAALLGRSRGPWLAVTTVEARGMP